MNQEHISPMNLRAYKHEWRDNKTIYLNSRYGFCKVHIYEKSRVAEIYDLIVYPEHRGNGYGRELLKAAEAYAVAENCRAAVLFPDCETWVERWYRRMGFYWDEDVLDKEGNPGMVKTLKQKEK